LVLVLAIGGTVSQVVEAPKLVLINTLFLVEVAIVLPDASVARLVQKIGVGGN